MFKLVTIITLLLATMTALAEEVENPDPLEGLNRGGSTLMCSIH